MKPSGHSTAPIVPMDGLAALRKRKQTVERTLGWRVPTKKSAAPQLALQPSLSWRPAH